MEYIETNDSENFGNFIVGWQTYYDFDNEKEIYNVFIEYDDDSKYSKVLDIFESYNENETKKYYKNILKNIKKTNNMGE